MKNILGITVVKKLIFDTKLIINGHQALRSQEAKGPEGHGPAIWIYVLKKSVLFEISWKGFCISSFQIRRFHEDSLKTKNSRTPLSYNHGKNIWEKLCNQVQNISEQSRFIISTNSNIVFTQNWPANTDNLGDGRLWVSSIDKKKLCSKYFAFHCIQRWDGRSKDTFVALKVCGYFQPLYSFVAFSLFL